MPDSSFRMAFVIGVDGVDVVERLRLHIGLLLCVGKKARHTNSAKRCGGAGEQVHIQVL